MFTVDYMNVYRGLRAHMGVNAKRPNLRARAVEQEYRPEQSVGVGEVFLHRKQGANREVLLSVAAAR